MQKTSEKFLFVEINNLELGKPMYHLIPIPEGGVEEMKVLGSRDGVVRMDYLDGDRDQILRWCRMLDDLFWLNINVWKGTFEIEKFEKGPNVDNLRQFEKFSFREPPQVLFGSLVEDLYSQLGKLTIEMD